MIERASPGTRTVVTKPGGVMTYPASAGRKGAASEKIVRSIPVCWSRTVNDAVRKTHPRRAAQDFTSENFIISPVIRDCPAGEKIPIVTGPVGPSR